MELQILLLLASALALPCNSFEFYSEENFIGLLPFRKSGALPWQENPQNCFTFPPNVRQILSSVRINDECIILYDQIGCVGYSVKLTEDAPNFSHIVGNVTNDNFDNKAASFQYCTEAEGLSKVGVELYSEENCGGEIIFQHNDLCKCTTLPPGAPLLSIDNHHNCVQLYSSTNCDGNAPTEKILPGKSALSGNLQSSKIYKNVNSLGPCTTPLHCIKISAKVYQYDVDGVPGVFRAEESTVAINLNAKSRFYNDGAATVIQEYTVSREITESTEIETVEFSSKVESWGKEKTFAFNFGTKIPIPCTKLLLGIELGKAMDDAYSELNGVGRRNREKHTLETTTEFGTSQLISVPPCSIYEVDSSVKVIQNMPLGYRMYFRLSGEIPNERKMTAEELIEQVKGINEYTYNHTIDSNTISAYAESSIKMSFGVEVQVDAVGSRLPNCYY